MKTIAWKLSLWKPNSFIVLCMHACIEFKLKISDRKKYFPAFLTTQIDQSSPADYTLHRPWKALKKGFKTSRLFICQILFVQSEINTWWVIGKWINLIVNLKHKYISLILISNPTGVDVNFFALEKTDKALYEYELLVLFFLANFYVEWKDIHVIDISASERQNCSLQLLSPELRVLLNSCVELPQIENRALLVQQNIGLATLLTNQSVRGISVIIVIISDSAACNV